MPNLYLIAVPTTTLIRKLGVLNPSQISSVENAVRLWLGLQLKLTIKTMNIVLATRNKKKVEEIKRIVRDMPVTIYTIDDFPGCPEVEEDGKAFEENAVKKARAVSKYTKMSALADDSGLEVDALDGAPGVFSARYAGEGADDRKNYEKLLREMSSVPDGKRGARFVCVLALAFPDSRVETFSGYAEGLIGRKPKGADGFGYDPVFYPKGYERTFAEMGDKEKDLLSHRGMALGGLYAYIKAVHKKN